MTNLLVEDDPYKVICFVRDRLVDQRFGSTNKNGTSCMLRGIDDKKCAVGHIIPDEIYYPEMDSCGLLEPHNKCPTSKWVKENYSKSYETLMKLQSIHDSRSLGFNKTQFLPEHFQPILDSLK